MTTDQDARRIAAIEGYGLLNDVPRTELQALVDLAALVSGVPMATINLITTDEQHQLATHGFEPAICRREDSMCAVSIQSDRPVIVPDASADDRFRDNPFVTGVIGNVRFYAAHQLRTPEDVVIGTLCVFDDEPRVLTADQEHALSTLAERVVDVLQLELTTHRLHAANQRLLASNERLGAFAGQVSHDLKNPLAAITMSLELALDEVDDLGPDETETVVSLLERASRGADRMQSMIGDLLSFARGGGQPERVDVDLAEVVREVQEDVQHPDHEGVVEAGQLPHVQGDPVQLRALLQNLVANGLKFARPGVPPRVTISARPVEAAWRIEVADNGRGIPVESRETVFEPFARIDKTVPGTGIGLSTCKRIVEAHGGRIGLEDAPDGGTLAWFELPA